MDIVNSIKNKKRTLYWDNVKFFLILLVVIGHFCDSLTNMGTAYKGVYIFIYSFHMPMFLFVSGLFTKYDDKHKLRIDKIVFYFILGYIFKILIYLILLAAGTNPDWSWLSTNIAPWYLFVLGGYLLTAYSVRKLNPYLVMFISIAISLAAGYFSFIDDFLTISKFIVFFPFFYLGFCLNPKDVLNFLNKKAVRIIGIVILLAFVLCCVFLTDYVYAMRPVYAAWHDYSEFPFSQKYGLFIRVFQYISSFAIMLGVASVIPRKSLGYATDAGKRTLAIYFWHYLIIKPIGSLGFGIMLINRLGALGVIIWFALSIILTLVLGLPVFTKPIIFLQNIINKLLIKLKLVHS